MFNFKAVPFDSVLTSMTYSLCPLGFGPETTVEVLRGIGLLKQRWPRD